MGTPKQITLRSETNIQAYYKISKFLKLGAILSKKAIKSIGWTPEYMRYRHHDSNYANVLSKIETDFNMEWKEIPGMRKGKMFLVPKQK